MPKKDTKFSRVIKYEKMENRVYKLLLECGHEMRRSVVILNRVPERVICVECWRIKNKK